MWADFGQLFPEDFNEVEYADNLVGLAVVQRMTGDLEAAEESIHRAMDIHRPAVDAAPDDPHLVGHLLSDLVEATRIFLARGKLLEGREARAEAIKYARFLLAVNPDDPGRLRGLAVLNDLAGQLASASGDHDTAVAHLKSAREVFPKSTMVHHGILLGPTTFWLARSTCSRRISRGGGRR